MNPMDPNPPSTNAPNKAAIRIGIYRTRYAGDIFLLVPLLHNIKESIPNADLFIIVNEGTEYPLKQMEIPFFLFRRKSFFEKTRSARDLSRIIQGKEFDLWVDLTVSDRSKFFTRRVRSSLKVGAGWQTDHRTDDPYDLFLPFDYDHGPDHVTVFTKSAFKSAGLELAGGPSNFFVPPAIDEKDAVDQFLLEHKIVGRPFIVVHPGARHWFKRWPPDRFGRVASWWGRTTGGMVIVIGTEEETTLMESVGANMDPSVDRILLKRSIPFLHALLGKASLFIGNDSAPLHLAHSTQTPLIALFGSTTPKVWGPIHASNSSVFYRPPACSPCNHTGCSMGAENCLLKITVDEVTGAMGRMGTPHKVLAP